MWLIWGCSGPFHSPNITWTYLHFQGIMHGDVKRQNDLVIAQGAKITDFDYALKVVADGESVIQDAGVQDTWREVEFSVDVWTLRCVVLEMITEEPLWHYLHDNDPIKVLYRIGFLDEVPEIPSHVSDEGKDFLAKCFKRDPSERGLVEELLRHGFIHTFNEHIDYELELGSFEHLYTSMDMLEIEHDYT
ncbi:mitogen-activated protein kinase kinase kinase 17-like [Arachis hypogaea]|nr:mitogen-activated protein kinase kinase kinase 17-like [Arachis hypogaea]